MRFRYWDACAFLGWLRQEADKLAECKAGIDHAEAGKLTLVTSALTIAEVLWLKGKDPIPAEDREKIRGFFQTDYIAIYDVDRTIAELAQDVIWDHGVKPKDAVHVATALTAREQLAIEQLDTFDGTLIGLSGQIGDPALAIGRPNLQQGLF